MTINSAGGTSSNRVTNTLGSLSVNADVTALTLNPKSFRADATLSVQGDLALPDDSAALVSSEGLLGGNFVELVPGGSLDNLTPGAEIEDTQGAVSVISLMMKFAGGGDDAAAPADGAVE